jgi:hypothetical protein
MFSNFIGYFLVPQVRFGAKACLPQNLGDLTGIFGLMLRDVQACLLDGR